MHFHNLFIICQKDKTKRKWMMLVPFLHLHLIIRTPNHYRWFNKDNHLTFKEGMKTNSARGCKHYPGTYRFIRISKKNYNKNQLIFKFSKTRTRTITKTNAYGITILTDNDKIYPKLDDNKSRNTSTTRILGFSNNSNWLIISFYSWICPLELKAQNMYFLTNQLD